MVKVAAILAVTVAAVVLLARFESRPPRTYNPNSALRAGAARVPPALERARPAPRRPRPGERAATGPAFVTPFSVVQVKAFVKGDRLTGVETVALAGDGPYTNALNARAEPILREEALRAGSADIDVVSGATSTSMVWLQSLEGAIEKARRRAGRRDDGDGQARG
jgi:uncharacterized protein with FMN-binding domain